MTMNAEMSTYEWFDQYLAGELSAAEKAQFEQRLAADAEFRSLFEDYRNIENSFKEYEQNKASEAAFTQTLTQLNRQHFGTGTQQSKGKVVSMKRRWFVVAAAASIIAAFFLLNPFTGGSGNLFNDYYEAESLSATRGSEDSASRIAEYYNAKDYNNALTLLEPYTEGHPDATDLQLAKAVCYLQTNRFTDAEAVLKPIAAAGTVYSQRAQWLRAMVQLKNDNKPACKEILQTIDSGSAYYERAQKLLKKL
jgi:tetratricopeptide (TPR) repeat protein